MHTRSSDLPLTQRQRIPIQTLYHRSLWGGQPVPRRAVSGDLRTTLASARHSVSQMYLCEEVGEVPLSDRPVRRLYFRLPPQGAMPQRSLQQLPSSYECLNDRRLFRRPYELAPASPRDSPMIAQAPPVIIPKSRPQGYRGHVPPLLMHQRPQLSISQINQRAFRRDTAGLVRPIEPPKSSQPISPRIAKVPPLLAPEDRSRRNRVSPLLIPHISGTNAASSARTFKIPRISTRDTPRIARSANIYGSGEGGGIKPTHITRKQLEDQESKEKNEVLTKLEDLQALRRELMKDIIKDDDDDGGDDEEGEEADDDDNDDAEEDEEEDEDDDETTLLEPLYVARGKKDDVQGTSDAEEINALSAHSFNFTNEGGTMEEGELLDDIDDPLEEYSLNRAQFRRLNRRFLNKMSTAYEQFENSILPTPFHLWYEEEPEDDYLFI